MVNLKKNTIVSVIVHCLDIPHFIEKCLDSLSGQTFNALEIICIYSELSEKSQKIIQNFCDSDSRFKIINDKNKTPNELRNYALSQINGDYFLICDTDNYYKDNAIAELVKYAQEYGTDLTICNTNIAMENNSDRRIFDTNNAYIYPLPVIMRSTTVPPSETNFIHMQKFFPSTLFKTDFLDKHNLKIPNEIEDDGLTFVSIAIMHSKKIFFISDYLLHKVIRPESGFNNENEYKDRLLQSCYLLKKYIKSHKNLVYWIDCIDRIISSITMGVYKKFIVCDYLEQVSVHLVDNCNLNCKSCSHFSCLAKKDDFVLDPKDFNNDMRRLAKITKQKIKVIELYGGEPLLHPNVPEIMRIARKHFKKNIIKLITNGTLLDKQDEKFWLALKKYNIVLSITKYPVPVNWEKVKNLTTYYGIKPDFFGGTGHTEKTLYHKPLDLNGRQNPAKSFLACTHSNSCINLYGGKLYPCPIIAYIHYFNRQFKKNLNVSSADYIDIYDDVNLKDIAEFMARPVPFCRHCKTTEATFGHKWEQTKFEISEYTNGDKNA